MPKNESLTPFQKAVLQLLCMIFRQTTQIPGVAFHNVDREYLEKLSKKYKLDY